MMRISRVAGAGVAVVAALALSTPPAAATAPVAGATYHGHVADAPSTENAVTFTVSRDGARVEHLRVGPYPMTLSCGSGGDPPRQSAGPAVITRGKFTAHVVYRNGDQVIARAKVTGTFLRRGKEKGVVDSHIVGHPNCNFSLPYTTRAE